MPDRGPSLDIYDVLRDADHPAFADVGRLLWTLVATQWDWVDRRVETVSLVGERRFRRHMSVDCRVPPAVIDVAEGLGLDRFVVPLRLVAERPLLSFDLHLGDHPIPFLTRAQGLQAERAVLRAAAEPLGRPLTPEVIAAVDAVPGQGLAPARRALDVLELTRPGHLGGTATPEQLAHWAITTFATGFMLLADVPLEAIRQRTVFKISEELGPEGSRSLPLWSEIGWRSTEFVFDAQDVVTTSSYHFQFIAPDGLIVASGQLFGAAAAEEAERAPFGTGSSQGQVLGVNAHVEDVPEADTYSVAVRLRPSPEGLLRASAISATFSTVLLFLAAVFVGEIDTEQLETSSALLLVLPGVVSTMFLRPGEHSLVSRLLRGTRTLLLTSAVIIYTAAAAVLVVGADPERLGLIWATLGCVSTLPTLALIRAARLSQDLAGT